MSLQIDNSTHKTNHYWAIHQKVLLVLWGDLSNYNKLVIADDVEKRSKTYRDFISYVDSEVDSTYNDPDFYYNDKYSFIAQDIHQSA